MRLSLRSGLNSRTTLRFKGLHHADPRETSLGPAECHDQQQRFHRCLPFISIVFWPWGSLVI